MKVVMFVRKIIIGFEELNSIILENGLIVCKECQKEKI